MQYNSFTSLNDLPRNPHSEAQSEYQLGIEPYVKGLVNFLKGTTTPMTVALQGEWGSGKTSLMYKLQDELCTGADAPFESIWINTWEYSLMAAPSQALLQIIAKMVSATEVSNFSGERAKNILGKLAKGVARTALSMSVGDTSIVDSVSEIFTTGGESTVGQLQEELRKNIRKRFESSGKRGIIFFIDDLDRLNPSMAVELLELLKNIFTIDQCVFVLAIDYDVVVKGLKGKFGELTDKNEREFRSFFDKIIQVPFAMPVANYKPKDFIISSLLEIGYAGTTDAKDTNFINNILLATKNTVGNNPRSIKRLMNILSLIKCISETTQSGCDSDFSLNHRIGRFINYVVMAIQVQYPQISRMLSLEPDFTVWDSETVKKMNVKELSKEQNELLRNYEESDEPWELALYAVCTNDPYMKGRFLELSALLNLLRDEITAQIGILYPDSPDADAPTLGEVMREAVQMSSVTSFSANDTAPVVLDDKAWKDMVYKFHDMISASIRESHPEWGFKPRKNTGNGGFNFTSPFRLEFPFSKAVTDGHIVMKFGIWYGNWWLKEITNPEFSSLGSREAIVAHPKIKDLFSNVENYIERLRQKNDWLQWSGITDYHNNPANFEENLMIRMPWFNFSFTDIDSFTDKDNVRIMSDVISQMVEFEIGLRKLFDN
ncbi:MAG: P-loop NTPase fold protein [Candidatus Cryptobacteroides sp.]